MYCVPNKIAFVNAELNFVKTVFFLVKFKTK